MKLFGFPIMIDFGKSVSTVLNVLLRNKNKKLIFERFIKGDNKKTKLKMGKIIH